MNINKEDRKNAIGISFSGGGCQGHSHVGALKALEELGIRPQYVSGTSAGAAIAALVAMGYNSEELKRYSEQLLKKVINFKTLPILKNLIKLKFSKNEDKNGLMDGAVVSNFIKSAMEEKGIKGFHDLPINLTICTADLNTTDECIFTTWPEDLKEEYIHYLTDVPLELAVRASMNFPGLFAPCKYKEYKFVDGGAKDNIPVKVLKDMGVGKVLSLSFDISKYNSGVGIDGTMKVIWRALDLYTINNNRKALKMADYFIEIKNSKTDLFSIDNMDLAVQEGYNAVMAHKDKLQEIFLR